jgi:hypothetical protein
MMLKTNAPERQAMLVRLMLAVVGMGLLVFTWFQLLQWAGAEP